MPASSALVPLPSRVQWQDGAPFVIGPDTVVSIGPGEGGDALGALVAEQLAGLTGLRVELVPDVPQGPALVFRASGEGRPEGYRLRVHAGGVSVDAADAAGMAYAWATIRQLIRRGPDGMEIPAVRIDDAPRFAWRGLSVDVARHYFGPPELRRVVELMSDYKFNVLHLHLSDDQGWRIDLPSRPELAQRSGASAVNGDPGGYLTGEEYQALIEFAAVRGIRVVPEVDVPGHVNAALHALPELTPDGIAPETYTGIEVGFSRLHADLPATRAFLRDVFGDLAAMTPGEYLHIGGDEVLTMEPAEYARLIDLASRAVRDAGKKVIGWQEIATTPLEPGTVVQFWDPRADPAPFVSAARAGARLLMSPGSRVYLDMKYDKHFPLGLEWAGFVSLHDSYDWEPMTLIEGLPADAVLGVEAAVWTETLRSLDELTTMLLPRLAAVAEVAWTPQELRGWDGFVGRVAAQSPYWRSRGLAFHPAESVPWPDVAPSAG